MPRDLPETGGDAPADLVPAGSAAEHEGGRARVEAKAQALDAAADRAKTATDRSESVADRPEIPADRAPVPMTPAARKADLLDQIATRSDSAPRDGGPTGPALRQEAAETADSPIEKDPTQVDESSVTEPEAESEQEDAADLSERPEGTDDPADSARTPMSQSEFWSMYPGEYAPPGAEHPKPDVRGPRVSPSEWIDRVNPDTGDDARSYNCGECARATESTWRGVPAVAGVLSDPDVTGERLDAMAKWAGADARKVDFAALQGELADAGPGSSALVAVYWKQGAGHWFNAVNDGGKVIAVDGREALTSPWPPSQDSFGFSEERVSSCYAILFDRNGRPITRESS